MSNPFTGTSDIWASLVANIAPLLVLVGEKHVKAYFKTMHKTSHHLLFAASPIGLVTAVTTLIRLSQFQLLKRLIGRQFEPQAQVLLDMTSVSCGEVGLELITGSLEQSLNPSPDNMAMFWIHGEHRGTPDELAEWIRANEWSVIKHIKQTSMDTKHSCYGRRGGIATASAARGKGPNAVWLVREKALSLWEGGSEGKAADGHIYEDSELYMEHSRPPPWYISDVPPRSQFTMKLKKFCEEERTKICSNNNMEDTTCEATGVAIAHLSDVSHVVTASENRGSWWLDALTYAFVLFSLCCNVGIVVAIGLTGGAPLTAGLVGGGLHATGAGSWLTAGLVGGGLLVTGAGSWLTALAVDNASEERKLELSHFEGTAAGFVSRDDPRGVELARCPKRAITSVRQRDYNRSRPFTKVVVPALLVFLMVVGFFALYLGLRSSPWWVSLSALGVAAAASCARSILNPQILLGPDSMVSGGIPYAMIERWGRDWRLNFSTEHGLEILEIVEGVTTCSFPHHAADSDTFLVSDSYEVVVPTGFIWALENLQSLPWKPVADFTDWDSFILLALHLAHEMRVKSIAPFELLGRFSGDDINPAGLVFLHSDVLAPGCVLRQPLEVLVAPAEDASMPGAIIESILVAIYNLGCRALRHPCYELGNVDHTHLDLRLLEPKVYAHLDGGVLKKITWTYYRLDPLLWAAAKMTYVIMLNVAEEGMLKMGRMWFPHSRARSEDGIRAFLQSMQSLELVVNRKPPSSSPSSSSPPLNHPSSSHTPPSHPPPSS